jgi:hypothetical protein
LKTICCRITQQRVSDFKSTLLAEWRMDQNHLLTQLAAERAQIGNAATGLMVIGLMGIAALRQFCIELAR